MIEGELTTPEFSIADLKDYLTGRLSDDSPRRQEFAKDLQENPVNGKAALLVTDYRQSR